MMCLKIFLNNLLNKNFTYISKYRLLFIDFKNHFMI